MGHDVARPDAAPGRTGGTVLTLPGRLSAETRALLPIPGTPLSAIHAAVDGYREAHADKKAAEVRMAKQKAFLLPPAIELFCRAWCERGARPKPPVTITNHAGSGLLLTVGEPTETPPLSLETAKDLYEALGPELYAECVGSEVQWCWNDGALADPDLRRRLLAVIAASDSLTAEEKRAVVVRDSAPALRQSVEGTLNFLAGRGWPTLMAGLRAMAKLVQQYFKVP